MAALDGAAALVRVRPVTIDDAERLLEWVNDPTTRAMSFDPKPIAPADHAAWLASRLASPTTRFYIGLANGHPIGQVRFERGPDYEVEISIAIAPPARGRGLGRGLLAAGIAGAQGGDPSLGGTTYIARVRPANATSIALFEGAGFVRRAPPSGDVADALIFVRQIAADPG